jgi:hydrogenase expression/formation protein HypC
MWLAVPGKIVSIKNDDPLMRIGQVSFGGILKEVNLVYVPEAAIDDYVIVHVGFAISILDPKEAERVFSYLDEIEQTVQNKEKSE